KEIMKRKAIAAFRSRAQRMLESAGKNAGQRREAEELLARVEQQQRWRAERGRLEAPATRDATGSNAEA
nr:hypothetical protein [Pirellulaceae bacterium]